MLDKTELSPTDEQQDIINLIETTNDNLLVNALAGTGKTTTLDMVQAASPQQPVLCLAFNKRIADEMSKRFPSTTTVRTFNSLGHRIWASAVGKISLDPKKTQAHLKEAIASLKGDDRRAASDAWFDIVSAISLAKALGYVPDGKFPSAKRLLDRSQFHASLEEKPSPLIADLIDSLLFSSIQASYKGLIDYNDQIFMPSLFGGTFPRFPHVLVDEAQDLNPTNHAMLDKLVKGRLCAVGDPFQSIYGFRGALQQGMQSIKAKFNCKERDLSITFRCPRVIVEAAHWRVPSYKWMKEGGHYEVLNLLSPKDIVDSSAIICRNNAPLFRIAFNLLSVGRSVSVAGSDIGPRLIRIMQKLGDGHIKQSDLLIMIENWRDAKLETSQSPKTIYDMAECMKVFASFGSTLDQAVGYAEHLFAQQGTIKLLTGHKAKGLEWDTVYHLDPWLIGDGEQEKNLRYVITTRAKEALYEINSDQMKWQH